MTSKRMRLLRVLGLAALLFVAVGQWLHAADQLFAHSGAVECEHHSEGSSDDCPAENSCCHAHGSSLVLPCEEARVSRISSRSLRFYLLDDTLPEGSVREIDHPPQLS